MGAGRAERGPPSVFVARCSPMTRVRSYKIACAAATFTGSGLCVPPLAAAHGLVGREDLPLPQWLFAWAAAAVLVASFFGLAAGWTRPRLQNPAGRDLFAMPAMVQALLGLCGIVVFAAVVYAGLAGVQVDTANLAPTVIFVYFWVAIPVLSVLLGDFFQYLSPWRAFGRGAGWLAGRVAGDSLPAPMAYPQRLGRWPAVAGLVGFLWIELVSADRGDPSLLATLALLYFAIQVLGMCLYGEREWTTNGDAFGGLFALCGRLSPLDWDRQRLALRLPLSGITTMATGGGAIALLCVLIGGTTFDGFSQGSVWLSLLPRLQDALTGLGFSPGAALQIAGTAGLLTCIGLVYGLYRIGIDGVRSVARTRSAAELAQQFAHTLLPIGIAYLVAHYLSLVAFQGQALAFLVSDPLGHGDDLFGTAARAIDYTWLSTNWIWYLQVAALLAGHIVGLILAHDRALALFDDERVATRSQYWMLAVMVCFTSLGLWLLASSA